MIHARTCLAAIMLVFLTVSVGHAADCDDPQDTASALACAGDDLAAADKILNALYRDLLTRLKQQDAGEAGNRLRTSQRNWISFRDAECSLRGHVMEGGTYQSVIETSCLAELTQERNGHLRTLLDMY